MSFLANRVLLVNLDHMGVRVAKYGMYLQSFFLSLLIISELSMAVFPGGTAARKEKQTNI